MGCWAVTVSNILVHNPQKQMRGCPETDLLGLLLMFNNTGVAYSLFYVVNDISGQNSLFISYF